MRKVVVTVPNWNRVESLRDCLDSLLQQSVPPHIIVVDNGSIDESVAVIEKHYPTVEVIKHDRNYGYAGGVNPGFKRAIELGAEYVAPFNNDALADPDWLKHLVDCLDEHPKVGIAACKLLDSSGRRLDSTGEGYSNWGLAYPRGRGEADITRYDDQTEIFGASGGASLYRVAMLEAVGLLDEDFFAYYEDIDLSFRAQLAGWRVRFVPESRVYHEIGGTSGKIKGFTTYQAMKNQPLLLYKNVPGRFLWRVGWRFALAYSLFFLRAVSRGQVWTVLKGGSKGVLLVLQAGRKRRHIQAAKTVSDDYIWSIMTHDLPPDAHALRKLRTSWWRLAGKGRR